jgi:hypothetical protein
VVGALSVVRRKRPGDIVTDQRLYKSRFRLVTWNAGKFWNVMVVDRLDGSGYVDDAPNESGAIAAGRRWAIARVNRSGSLGIVPMRMIRRLR